tara:strand:+ start:597 stop:830 length:234 start_codon:yes stop_codon:yes gene_type:complete
MEKYKIDWKDLVYGTIEIDAENGSDAENKFMNMSLKELLEKSSTGSDEIEREIRFVSPSEFSEPMSVDEWEKYKKYF